MVSDPGPFPGSNLDTNTVKPPYNFDDENPANPTLNLTFASLPLSFMGSQVNSIVAQDANPPFDPGDVQHDINATISKTHKYTLTGAGISRVSFSTRSRLDGNATVDLAPSSTPHGSYIFFFAP